MTHKMLHILWFPLERLSSKPFDTNMCDLSELGNGKSCEEAAQLLGTGKQLVSELFCSLNPSGTWECRSKGGGRTVEVGGKEKKNETSY